MEFVKTRNTSDSVLKIAPHCAEMVFATWMKLLVLVEKIALNLLAAMAFVT